MKRRLNTLLPAAPGRDDRHPPLNLRRWFNQLVGSIACALFSLFSCVCPVYSEGLLISEWDQMMIFLKVLTYNRVIAEMEADTLKIGVLFDSTSQESENNKNAIVNFLEVNHDKTIKDHHYSYVLIDSASRPLQDNLANEEITVLYVTTDHDEKLPAIIKATRDLDILTLTGNEVYVRQGASISLGIRDGSPRIILNLKAVNEEGHNFSANLYRVCEVIR